MLRRRTCADKISTAKSPPMKWRNRILFLCALVLASALSAGGQDVVDSEAVRPSGISPGPVRKAQAVTAEDEQDDGVSPRPVWEAQGAKSTPARSHPEPGKPEQKPE